MVLSDEQYLEKFNHNAKRNKVILDMDIIDMQTNSKQNDEVKYILLIIDIFSRFVLLQPLHSAKATDILTTMKVIFKETKPEFLCTDNGGLISMIHGLINRKVCTTFCHLMLSFQRVNMYVYLNKNEATFKGGKEYIFNIESGLWLQGTIGLCEIEYEFTRDHKKKVPKYIDICCDLCDTSLLNGNQSAHLLRRIHVDKAKGHQCFNPVYYIPVIKPWTPCITIYIKGSKETLDSFEFKTLNCTLHIQS